MAEKIAQLDEFSEDQLLATINRETDATLKQSAVARLHEPSHLLPLAKGANSDALTVSARKRLGELLELQTIPVSSLATTAGDPIQLLELCSYSASAGAQLLASIDDEQVLARIATNAPTTALRQSAAEKIESRQWLAHTLKNAKDKDKSVYKIVKAKLSSFKDEQARKDRINQTAQSLCLQLRTLTKRDRDEIFIARKKQIESAWVELAAEVDGQIAQEFADLSAQLTARLEQDEQRAEQARQQQDSTRQALTELTNIAQAVNTEIARMLQQGDGTRGEQELQRLEKSFNDAWALANEADPAFQKQAQVFARQTQQALAAVAFFRKHPPLDGLVDQLESCSEASQRERLLASIEKALTFCTGVAAEHLPSSVDRAGRTIDTIRTEQAAHRQENKQRIDEGFAQIRRLNTTIQTGRVRRAKALYADLEKLIGQLENCPTALQTSFEDTTQAMNRLGDWHEFAVTPKKQALLTRMTELCQSHLHPRELAEEIRLIQEEWKLLSRGGQKDDAQLWEAFKEAGRQAFEPCKAYFAEQEQQRQANLEKRRTLCETVAEYLERYDWDNANWREVEKTLRLSRDAWTSYWPVDRKQNKALQNTFDGLMHSIHQKLEGEFERNRSRKEALVVRAAEISAQANSHEAIAEIKKLQVSWQEIGPCKPGVEQKLWRALRTHCDAVFERRKTEHQAQQAERQSVKADADALLAHFAKLLELNGDEFRQARPQIDELIGQFQQLGELPKADVAAIQADFRRKLDRLDEKVLTERLASQRAIWEDMLTAFRLLMTFELTREDPAAQDAAREALSKQLQEGEKWPREVLEEFQARLHEPLTVRPADEAEAHFRRLCVQAETLNDLPSPTSDQALRMAFQVEQLQHGLGRQNPNSNMSLETYLTLWMKSPALAETGYRPLELRMRKAWGWLS